jgi:hypothetical protein
MEITTMSILGRPRTQPNTTQRNEIRTRDLERYYSEEAMLGWATSAYRNAKQRASRKNIPFSITIEDVLRVARHATHCPISGTPLYYGRGHGKVLPNSASIDRINNNDPDGYSPDSICVISNRCNTIKNNATIDELIMLGEYAKLCQKAT